jgi:hypothetical protein
MSRRAPCYNRPAYRDSILVRDGAEVRRVDNRMSRECRSRETVEEQLGCDCTGCKWRKDA